MNTEQREFWNSEAGERWTRFQEELDRRLRVYCDAVLDAAALRPGMRVLDVGCGCGDTTLTAAKQVGPSGHACGLDISEPMLGRAKERGRGISQVRFSLADATTFSAEQPFDAVISRFGVMFFEDPARAFANLRAQTKPSGTLTFVCWQSLAQNPWANLPFEAAQAVVPPQDPVAPPSPDAPGPFSLADAKRLRGILADSGWHDVQLRPFETPMLMGDTLDDAVYHAMRVGPASRLANDADEPTRAKIIAAVRAVFAPYGPKVELPSATWLVTARA